MRASVADIGRSLLSLRGGSPAKRVAKAAGISVEQLLLIEQGRSTASLAVYQRVARALGTTLADVATWSMKSGPSPVAPSEAVRVADVASAIVRLQVDGSKVDAAVDASVLEALRMTGNNQSAAARLLGMERKAFCRRMVRARRRSRKRR